jgi:hypothetical protein
VKHEVTEYVLRFMDDDGHSELSRTFTSPEAARNFLADSGFSVDDPDLFEEKWDVLTRTVTYTDWETQGPEALR